MAEALTGLAVGAVMIAVGIVLAIFGLAVTGFVVMLLCAIWALNSWRQMATNVSGPGAADGRGGRSPRRASPPQGSFFERIDEAWRRRQEGDY